MTFSISIKTTFICEYKFVYIWYSEVAVLSWSLKIMTLALNKHITSCHLIYHTQGEKSFHLNV
jgi:hypothetical protein